MDLKDKKELEFTRSWFLNRNLPTFREYIYPEWQGKPITYLEIGVFEGMSLVWMLQHVLTHPNCRAIGIDPWLMTSKLDSDYMREVMSRATKNTSKWRWQGICGLIQANSAEVLRRMVRKNGYEGISRESVDICMIDGNHNDYAVLDDALLCLQLVKPGGWLLFDDIENDKEKVRHVKQGTRLFLGEVGDKIQLVWKHRYMECYRREK